MLARERAKPNTDRIGRLGTLLLGLLLAGACRGSPAPPPSVVIITIDTLRADRVSAYGFDPATTPHIDRIAASGVVCADAATSAPITLPAHASIFTGLYPPAHGVRDNGAYALGDAATTMAERFKAAGYDTAAFVSAVVLGRRYNLSQGFDLYDDDLWGEDAPPLFMIRERSGSKTARRFVSWLRSERARQPTRPVFAWIHLFDPHQPYKPVRSDMSGLASPYDGEVRAADRAIGEITAALRHLAMLDRTIIVITADHGESLGEHGERTHGVFVYDATVHVPLIMRYPPALHASTYAGPVRHVDIMPTLLALAGVAPSQTQGVDLSAPLAGRVPAPQLSQYSESMLSETGFGMAPLFALRRSGLARIRAPRSELYDLARDPGETRDVAAVSPAAARGLDAALDALLADCRRRAVVSRANPMEEETLESLQALGYLAPAAERSSMRGIDPKDGIALYDQLEEARHHVQADDWQGAEALLRRLLDQAPDHVAARNVLGLVLFRQGKLQAARDQYTRSLERDAGQPRVQLMLASIALASNDLDGAEEHDRKALAITPQFVEAMCSLGFVRLLKGDAADAERYYQEAMRADPGFPRAARLYADLLYDRSEYGKALGYYQRVLAVLPGDFRALVQSASCQRHLGQLDGAERTYLSAAAARPDSWIPRYNLACLAAVRGNKRQAIEYLELAARMGVSRSALMREDPDLATLRDDDGFRRLVATLDQ